MAVNMYKCIVMIEISQGSADTQTTLGGSTINPLLANYIECTPNKKYEIWLAPGKVIAIIKQLTFVSHPVHWRQHIIIKYRSTRQ